MPVVVSGSDFFNEFQCFTNSNRLVGLSLHSFLMLPMQRITRLPLLVDAVLSKLKTDDDEFESWKMTLAILNKVNFCISVSSCSFVRCFGNGYF